MHACMLLGLNIVDENDLYHFCLESVKTCASYRHILHVFVSIKAFGSQCFHAFKWLQKFPAAKKRKNHQLPCRSIFKVHPSHKLVTISWSLVSMVCREFRKIHHAGKKVWLYATVASRQFIGDANSTHIQGESESSTTDIWQFIKKKSRRIMVKIFIWLESVLCFSCTVKIIWDCLKIPISR